MAYKKYIKRNGKLYGPYIYHSRRVNGKVVSEYQGTAKKIDYKKFVFIFLGIVLVLGLGYGTISNRTKLTGNLVDLDGQTIPGITNLTVTKLHENNESIHRYDLNLETIYPSDFILDYGWDVDCGYFYVNNESVGTEYLGYGNIIEWHTTGECGDAIISVEVISTNTTQELVQSVFNPGDRLVTDVSMISSSENVTEEEIVEEIIVLEEEGDTFEEEVEVAEEIIVQEIVKEIFALSDEEKQILINEFGNQSVESKVKSFNNRTIVRYEYGGMWIENSYDSYLSEEELEKQMEIDRIKWLRDIINQISKEETQEQELEGFEDNYSI